MKLKISEAQLEIIINHIQESNYPKPLIEEGWKEVVLGTAMLLGVNLSGVNAQTAQNALNDEQIIKQIENTLETDKIDQLAQTLEDAGLNNAKEKMISNANKLKNNFEKVAKKRGLKLSLDFKDEELAKQIKSRVRQGYAVQDIKITKDTILPEDSTVLVQDTLDINYSSDNLFITAGFELTDEAKNDISSTIKQIQSVGGTVVKVVIESSTDKEPIKMGNEKLAELRANSVEDVINDNKVEGDISIVTNPDSGPDLYSRTMSPEQREEARKETAKYRYVKVKFISVIPVKSTKEKIPEIVDKLEVQLVRGQTHKKGTTSVDGGGKSKNRKFKCLKVKVKGKVLACPDF